jgi:hypothetical protein
MITKNNDGAEGFLSSFKPLVHDFGKDEDGDPVEVCLAEPVEGDRTDTQTSQKISSKQRLALDALAECAATPLPSALGLSPVLMGATVDQWRAEMMRRSIIDKGARNPRADFKRLKEQMQVNNLIGIYDDLVWRAIP